MGETMKNKLVHMMLSIVSLAVCLSMYGLANAGVPPQVAVSLAMVDAVTGDNTTRFMLSPQDPVKIVLTIENEGAEEVIVPSGFSTSDFLQSLLFVDPDGEGIILNDMENQEFDTPPFARVMIIDGVRYQVEQVEILPPGWVLVVEIPDAHVFYNLEKAGWYAVQANIPLRTYPAVDLNYGGADFAKIEASEWESGLKSNSVRFALIGDGDSDGYSYPVAVSPYFAEPDCDDDDPLVNPGAAELAGNGVDDDCDPATSDEVIVETGTILVDVYKHYVGGGSHPPSNKEPLEIPVKLYDQSDGSCAANMVSQLNLPGFSWQSYPSVWLGSCAPLAYGISTGGEVSLTVPAGDGGYLILGKYDQNGVPFDGDDVYIGAHSEGVAAGETMTSKLKIIEKVDGKKVAAKYTRRTGSELLIIEPEYIEWDGTSELYPFVFESSGDWDVATSVAPPEGFVSDHEILVDTVNTDTKALQFVVTDIGSEWVATDVEHEISHKGKKEKIKSKIGIKCAEKLAKEKNFDRYCKEKKTKKNK